MQKRKTRHQIDECLRVFIFKLRFTSFRLQCHRFVWISFAVLWGSVIFMTINHVITWLHTNGAALNTDAHFEQGLFRLHRNFCLLTSSQHTRAVYYTLRNRESMHEWMNDSCCKTKRKNTIEIELCIKTIKMKLASLIKMRRNIVQQEKFEILAL